MPSVLIVNCNPDRAKLLRKLMAERADLVVVGEAQDGLVGLELCRSLQPDLLFTCIGLRGMSGLELIRSARAEIPGIAVLVGSVQADAKEAALEAGADAFLAYPVSMQVLLDALDTALSRAS